MEPKMPTIIKTEPKIPKIEKVITMEMLTNKFLEYNRNQDFNIYKSFPLVATDPTVLFTNATITPFKSMFTGEVPFANFALVQRCLRLGGTGGTQETARTNLNYTSLFNMLGSGIFEIDHDNAIKYFIGALDALGLDRKNLIFSSIDGHALNSALMSSSLDPDQVRVFEDPSIMQHEWSFGEGDLHGIGVIAWFTKEGYDKNPELADCVQIGRIVHIDGVSEGDKVKLFDHTAFDIGLGMGRLGLALNGDTNESMQSWRDLSSKFKTTIDGVSEGDAHYMANLFCVINELTAEGLMPGNKMHMHVLRKIIRSLVEEIWLQSGQIIDINNFLSDFSEGFIDKSKASEAIDSEEKALRAIISKANMILAKYPNMTPEELNATYGIKPNILKIVTNQLNR